MKIKEKGEMKNKYRAVVQYFFLSRVRKKCSLLIGWKIWKMLTWKMENTPLNNTSSFYFIVFHSGPKYILGTVFGHYIFKMLNSS